MEARRTAALEVFTVEEAAAVLRIGRTSAYAMAREYLRTGGASGLPVVRVGHQLRVPRAALEQLISAPVPAPRTAISDTSAERRPPAGRLRETGRRRVDADQATLAFPS